VEILRECEIVGRTIETYPTIPSQAGSKTHGRCTLTVWDAALRHNSWNFLRKLHFGQ